VGRIGIVLLATFLHFAGARTPSNPYPEEVGKLQFYEKYLAPLLPNRSDEKQVVQVLGSDKGRDLGEWKIVALYSCDGDPVACSHGGGNDRLYQIEVTPKQRVSLSRTTFPSSFVHKYGAVSEINITCDVYTASSGLEYWVVSNGFPSYRKGDLFRVLYGAPLAVVGSATAHSTVPKR
jgi:hypothetical protein